MFGPRRRRLHRQLPARDQGAQPEPVLPGGRRWLRGARSGNGWDRGTARRSRRRLPPRRSTGGADELGVDLRRPTCATTFSATQRIFEAAVHHGIKVVYASSSSVYGDAEAYPLQEDAKPLPVSPYGVSKLACEALASTYTRSLGLDAVGLRYFSVYGPRQRPDMAFAEVFDCLARKRPFRLFGNGHQSRDFTFVADVVEATLAAMRCRTVQPGLQRRRGLRDLDAGRADPV